MNWKGFYSGFPQRPHGFDPRAGQVGFVVDKVLLVPLPVLIAPTAPHHLVILSSEAMQNVKEKGYRL
jgi:hypothetical protein